MKNTTLKPFVLMMVLMTAVATSSAQIKTSDITGAWETGTDVKMTRIYTDQFFVITTYNVKDRQFIATSGGRWRLNGKEIVETLEFSSATPDKVGTEISTSVDLKDNKLSLTADGTKGEWIRVDNGTPGKLSGAWLITGRMNDGKMGKMTPGARRTMKILSGTRFQWIAYNVDTKEFFGTGGGTYTTEKGKYTENILFFSRDNNRVGASLQFDFALEDGNWRHKGLSSKGDPIDEVWTKREKVGL
ncbi:membrane or secreted protein [Dawidia soli]|uniref:Membrane or secreted protein n=1 Tax=Dawidia soli TaxID=2782352 RepID=A0AAP2GKI1_9BACT|nr:membrane or secreted protein [Dawidia soli]MBT1689645.1 membrane or secreted protein [Dawidia soli]